jgi:hypothetical protein
MFYQDMKDNRDFNTWNENMNAVAEMDCTHNVPNEKHAPKDDREKAVSQKIQQWYTVLEESLNMEQAKLNEFYDTYNAYDDLKTHAMEFTREQLSCNVMCHYMLTIPQPDKCCARCLKLYSIGMIKSSSIHG